MIKETNDHTHATNRGEVQGSKVRQEMNFFSCFGFMPTQTVFLKTTNLLEAMLVTIALSVSYALEKPIKFLKNETQKFSLGVLSGGSLSQGFFVRGVLSGGLCPGGFCPRTSVNNLFL